MKLINNILTVSESIWSRLQYIISISGRVRSVFVHTFVDFPHLHQERSAAVFSRWYTLLSGKWLLINCFGPKLVNHFGLSVCKLVRISSDMEWQQFTSLGIIEVTA